eukprot:421131-Rhodomonas_salina.3
MPSRAVLNTTEGSSGCHLASLGCAWPWCMNMSCPNTPARSAACTRHNRTSLRPDTRAARHGSQQHEGPAAVGLGCAHLRRERGEAVMARLQLVCLRAALGLSRAAGHRARHQGVCKVRGAHCLRVLVCACVRVR